MSTKSPHTSDAATIAGNVPIQTAAQVRRIIDVVNEFRGEDIRIATNGAGNPILITDVESDAMLVVQMPCRLQSDQSQAA
jgi:DNA polymerase III sliding clamp (beta) subunit (PCNA family)